MTIRSYDINLDSFNATIPEPIIGRQGDKNGAVTLHVSITDRGTAVDLTGQTINLMAETAKETAIIADNLGVTLTDAVNGKFDYAIPNALWSESGKITRAYFSLNDTDGQQTTYDLIFIVKKAIDVSQDKADDYITIIDGTLRDLKTKIDAIYAEYQNGSFYSRNEIDNMMHDKVTDNHDGTVVLNGENKRLATSDNAVMTDVGRLNNVNIVRDYNYIGESKDLKAFKESVSSDGKFKILYVTDMHYGEGTNDAGTANSDEYRDYVKAPPLTKLMLKNLALLDGVVDASIWNGDLIHGHEGKDVNKIHNISISGMIRGVMPNTDAFIGIGNHEDGTVWNYQEPITKEELLSEYDYDNNNFGETRSGFAAYKDYDESKIRIIHIAGYDNPELYDSKGDLKYPRGSHSVFTQEQLDFVIESLNGVPDGYTVIMFNHGPLLGFFGNTPYSTAYNVNHDLLNGILSAFVNNGLYSGEGSNEDYPASVNCDFSNKTAYFAGIITGHEHRDKGVQTVNGVKSVMRTCFLAADRGGDGVGTSTTDADFGTKQQYAFDVIEIDTANKKVEFKRFGKGSNYEYEY